ncbi:MAG: hypothetical protein IT435_00110 [Phycisphaerales bacterium]|nr:hypothetical protein [Phycisphaerales bacterium]
MLTLWDLLPQSLQPKSLRPAPDRSALSIPKPRPSTRSTHLRSAPRKPKTRRAKASGMQARYDKVVAEMLATYGVRVRRWRRRMSGVAWTITYQDGSVSRLIESPKPKGPMSAAIFLHEIGHHALGIGICKPRCLEEYHAWTFAIREMEARGLNVTDAVHRRMRRSLEYAIGKAVRRGLQSMPQELTPYLPRQA